MTSPCARLMLCVGATLCLLSCGADRSFADILTVKVDGTGDFESVGDAVEAAQDGDEIRVFPGVYDERLDGGEVRVVIRRAVSFSVVGSGDVHVSHLLIRASTAGGQATILVEGIHFSGPGPVLHFLGAARATIRSCVFEGLVASSVGEIGGGAVYGAFDLTVDRCRFVGCESDFQGGALSAPFSLLVSESEFVGCAAPVGGAIYGGLDSVVENCLFWKNTSPGACIEGRNLKVRGSVLWSNDCKEAVRSDDKGLALGVTVENSTIGETSGGVATASEFGVRIRCSNVLDEVLHESIGGVDSTNVISLDPEFCAPDSGDFSLKPTSPCLEGAVRPCPQMGPLGIGCELTPVVSRSWGELKEILRANPELDTHK